MLPTTQTAPADSGMDSNCALPWIVRFIAGELAAIASLSLLVACVAVWSALGQGA